jgi:hypothetical protein
MAAAKPAVVEAVRAVNGALGMIILPDGGDDSIALCRGQRGTAWVTTIMA